MNQKVDGLVMFSGGLDSTVAAHILKSQGLSVVALHFVLPFYSGLGNTFETVRQYAQVLDIPLIIEEEGAAFLEMVRSPEFGFGKNANPCLDCRIHRCIAARKIMEETGASFVATGEVAGQRPKSQRLSCLHVIERRAGLMGRLLRPLSAGLLPPTIPEKEGLVDRDRLFSLSGRGRQVQLSYARKYGLKHNSPAGGCILTTIASSRRYLSLAARYPDFTLDDFKLIAYGRHFAVSDRCRLVVARDDAENNVIEKIAGEDDLLFDMETVPGPLGLGRGMYNEEEKRTAASFVVRYSRARDETSVRVRVYRTNGESSIVCVTPAAPGLCESCRM